MYSYADRIRAVELYIKLGLRVRATIHQLGYPTYKNRLERLVSALPEASGFTSEPSAKRAPKYSLQAKTGGGCSLPRLRSLYCCHDEGLGYPGRGTLTAWVRQDCPEVSKSMVGRSWPTTKPDALMCEGVVQLCARQSSAQEIADKLEGYAREPCTTGKISCLALVPQPQ